MLREDRTAADRKMPLSRPAAGGESCFAGFFLVLFYGQIFKAALFPVFTSGNPEASYR